jgi:hypothetical protein
MKVRQSKIATENNTEANNEFRDIEVDGKTRGKQLRTKYGLSKATPALTEQPEAGTSSVVAPATIGQALANLQKTGDMWIGPANYEDIGLSDAIVAALLASGAVIEHPKYPGTIKAAIVEQPKPEETEAPFDTEPQSAGPRTDLGSKVVHDARHRDREDDEAANVVPARNSGTDIVRQGDPGDPYAYVPEHDEGDVGAGDFIGSLVKLDQDSGEFLMFGDGGDGEILPEDLWVVEGIRWAWNRFEDNKVVERRPYGNGIPKPDRSELDPPPPEKGRDCWADTPYGYMIGWETGLSITVTGSGTSMRNAFIRLTRAIRTKQQMGGGLAVKPVIELHSRKVSGQGYDDYWVPRFPIPDWVLPDGSRVSKRGRSLRDDLDDEIR